MLKTRRLAVFLGAALLTASPAFAEGLKVVASFSIIGDFAAHVGGERVDLVTLVGPNGDAHVYEPRPSDAVAMARADVILVNGLQFEGFLSRLVEASGTAAPIVELSDGGDILDDPEGGHFHHYEDRVVFHEAEHDPHAWQSVGNARVYVRNIAQAFCAADVDGCETYLANAATYIAVLDRLEDEIRRTVAAIPEDQRVVIVPHDAFRYFDHAYGIRFLAPEGVSTESEASAADVADLIRQVREARAAAIFTENISNPRLIEQIASETGMAVGGMLYSDALSEPDGPAATYVDMMRHNMTTIATAIQGE